MMISLLSISNSYVRAAIVAGIMFVLVLFRLVQMRGGNWASQHRSLIILVLGFSTAITAVIVGTISRKSKSPWPWLLIGGATLGCGLLVMYAMLFMQKLSIP